MHKNNTDISLIREILKTKGLVDNPNSINEHTDLFKEGILDSLGFVGIIIEIESKRGINIDFEKLTSREIKTPLEILELFKND